MWDRFRKILLRLERSKFKSVPRQGNSLEWFKPVMHPIEIFTGRFCLLLYLYSNHPPLLKLTKLFRPMGGVCMDSTKGCLLLWDVMEFLIWSILDSTSMWKTSFLPIRYVYYFKLFPDLSEIQVLFQLFSNSWKNWDYYRWDPNHSITSIFPKLVLWTFQRK